MYQWFGRNSIKLHDRKNSHFFRAAGYALVLSFDSQFIAVAVIVEKLGSRMNAQSKEAANVAGGRCFQLHSSGIFRIRFVHDRPILVIWFKCTSVTRS